MVRPDVITARRTAASVLVALGHLLAEAAHHEQSVVDGDTQAHQRDDGLGEEVHRHEFGEEAHDAERAGDGQAADEARQCRCDDATENEEQHDAHQRDGSHFGALLVLADSAGELAGERVEARQLDIAVVDLLQVGLDGLVVLQNGVVVVALERDADERLRHVRGLHLLDGRIRAVGGAKPAHPAHHPVLVVGHELVELVGGLLHPLGVVDLLAVWRRQDRDDVARPVASIGFVGRDRRCHRLAALVVETTLGDVVAEADSVHAAADAQRDHDADDDVPESVHRSTPPGEHVSS